MAQGNDDVCSQSFTEETTNTQRQLLVAGTLTYPPLELPTLPFDLFPEILCRLPVKLLIQLRCLCKFFNSLISDPKFAKKHLRTSNKRHHIMLTNDYVDDEFAIYDSPIPSVFSTSTVFTETQLYIPTTLTNGHHVVKLLCSCDGMFCGQLDNGSYFLWNPSIRNFKLLPPLEDALFNISFGYDHFIHNYKLVGVFWNNEVCVNTLGTDYWRKIEDIRCYTMHGPGIFVCGTVNWYASDFIISLDLEKESCQKFSLPDFRKEYDSWDLGVVRDSLCVFANSDEYWDVWIMKEYGNQESWTICYTIPVELLYTDCLQDQDLLANTALYISEDDQLLVKCEQFDNYHDATLDDIKLVVYDSKTGILNIPEFQNSYEHTDAVVYIESLISP